MIVILAGKTVKGNVTINVQDSEKGSDVKSDPIRNPPRPPNFKN